MRSCRREPFTEQHGQQSTVKAGQVYGVMTTIAAFSHGASAQRAGA